MKLSEIFGWAPPPSYVCIGKPVKVAAWDSRRGMLSNSPNMRNERLSRAMNHVDNCWTVGVEKNRPITTKIEPDDNVTANVRDVLHNSIAAGLEDIETVFNNRSRESLEPLQLTPVQLNTYLLDDSFDSRKGSDKKSEGFNNHENNDIWRRREGDNLPSGIGTLTKDLDPEQARRKVGKKPTSLIEEDSHPDRKQSLLYSNDAHRGSIHLEDVMKHVKQQQQSTFLSVSFPSTYQSNDNSPVEHNNGLSQLYLKKVRKNSKPRPVEEPLISEERRQSRGNWQQDIPEKVQMRRNTIYWADNLYDSKPVDLESILAHRRHSQGPAFLSLSFQGDEPRKRKENNSTGKHKRGALYLRGAQRKSTKGKDQGI